VEGSVRALRLADGAELRHATVQVPLLGEPQPQVVGSALYVATTDGAVVALRATDGAILWQTQFGGAAA
jgi:outer membrane protein assembly factor BamB